ncbi:MAG: type II secretion system F family protein [Sarcina sp.]
MFKNKIDLKKEFEFKKISYESIVYICSSLEVYISSGINFIKALELIEIGVTEKRYKKSIKRIIKKLNDGESIAQAFLNEDYLYTSLFSDMLVVAEQSGQLETVLINMTKHFEKQLKLEKEIKSAILYPKIIFTAGIIVFILFLDFVLPNIVSMYEGLNVESSQIIQAIININSFFEVYNIYFCVATISVIGIIIYLIIKKITKDKDLLHFLKIRRQYKELNLISIINLVLDSGIPITYALERVFYSISNKDIKSYIGVILEKVQIGENISDAISHIDVISKISHSFFISGENSGSLDKTTLKLLNILENNFSKRLGTLISRIEPISICILGVFILFLVLIVFVPMYGYMQYV